MPHRPQQPHRETGEATALTDERLAALNSGLQRDSTGLTEDLSDIDYLTGLTEDPEDFNKMVSFY